MAGTSRIRQMTICEQGKNDGVTVQCAADGSCQIPGENQVAGPEEHNHRVASPLPVRIEYHRH